ncbi:MAG: outer membrane protein assembly factor BamA [Nitrospirae bacterium RBG_16_64_22]|nr:MAG: outer membrane protein assembly factor BamA [Nitrospirae bacterium RBG_16_64_22]
MISCAAFAQAGETSALAGRPITSVAFEGLVRFQAAEAQDLAGFNAGEPLDGARLSRAIKRLMATGRFGDVQVEGKEEAGGTRLVFRMTEHPFLRKIAWDIPLSMRDEIERRVPFRTNGPFDSRSVPRVERRIVSFLRGEGFASPVVEVRSVDESSGNVDLQVRIVPGEPKRWADVEVVDRSGTKVDLPGGTSPPFGKGTPVRAADVRHGAEKLLASLRERGWFEASVSLAVEADKPDPSARFTVETGPWYDVRFEGGILLEDPRWREEVRRVLTDWTGPEAPGDAARVLERYYREAGYPFSRVDAKTDSVEGAARQIVFQVDPGPRPRVVDVRVSGARQIGPEEVLPLLSVQQDRWYARGFFDPGRLEEDVETIRAFYRSRGFLSADVGAASIDLSPDRSSVSVEFQVREGERTFVRSVDLAGLVWNSREELLPRIQTRPESPYEEEKAEEDRIRILEQVARKGHLQATVDLLSTFFDEGRSVGITFDVDEHETRALGRIIVLGLDRTRRPVAEREIGLKEGDPYDFEGFLLAENRLRRLGIFSEARFHPVDPLDESPVRDVVLSLKEADAGTVEFGAGYGDYERWRGMIEVSHRNVGGWNRRVSGRLEASTLEKRFLLTGREPRVLETEYDLRAQGVWEETEKRNIDTHETIYKIRRSGVAAGPEGTYASIWKASLTYQYENTTILEISPGAVLSREDEGRLGVSSLTPALFLDLRDDPFEPRRGLFAGVSVKGAAKAIGSEISFYKLSMQASAYVPLTGRVVLAVGGKWGRGKATGEDRNLPVFDRFFLGGRSSVRGFSQDTLGPKGADGTPSGGNVIVQGNVELRWSLGREFQVVAFADAGNVWLVPPAASDLKLRQSAGVGVRYKTPVGPLRLDYARKIDREPGESAGEWHFSLGHAF